ncbi:hypothetical protein AAG570_007486 [Ranatra chinensis]|uniref:Uncharacterized protein n=1 Tax=Ranatra chinensis TaxID=642074 RepID=A0ABD0XW10_9HEMI
MSGNRRGCDNDMHRLGPKTEGNLWRSPKIVSLLLSGREKGESPGGFAQSMEIRTRMIWGRILETETDPVRAQHAIELVSERIRRDIPERINKVLKTATPMETWMHNMYPSDYCPTRILYNKKIKPKESPKVAADTATESQHQGIAPPGPRQNTSRIRLLRVTLR